MSILLDNKRPDEVRDHTHSWAPWLDTDQIADSEWVVDGVTLDDDEFTDDTVTIWFSGGVVGTTATLTNTITTDAGRTETEVFYLNIAEHEEPISLTQAKAQLRKTTDDEDGLICSYIRAAREWVEEYTGHILVQRTVQEAFPAWGNYLTLSKQPILVGDPTPALTVMYHDVDGNEVEYEGRIIRDERYPWLIYPPSGLTFPTLATNGTVTVSYTAGYNGGQVPEIFRQAIKVLLTSMYASRGIMDEGSQETCRFLLRSKRGAVMA